jgi:signal transduction histidine kinase
VRGERRAGSGSGPSVKERLAEIAESSGSTNEFVHGLSAFVTELAARDPDHPLLRNLTADMGRKTAEAVAAGLLHDLAAPLQLLRTHLDVMQATLRGTGDPTRWSSFEASSAYTRVLDHLGAALRAARHAQDLSHEGLRRIARDDLQPALEPLLEAAAAFARRVGSRLTAVTVDAKVSGHVHAPQSDLLRVLYNLVHNAGEATLGQSEPMVTISAWQSDDDAFVQVADNGPGISAEHLEHIFELFFTTRGQGTGVGLYVCKTLVEGWGGRLRVDSRPGEGARFTVSIPRVAAPRAGPEAG